MQLNVGDKVIVRGSFGNDLPEEVTVEEIDEKNGRPLFDYTSSRTGDFKWAYFSQVIKIVRRAS